MCKPNPQARRRDLMIGDMTIRPNEKLVTYVSRDLEPYRGFHAMMRAVPHLLRARKDVRVVMVGGDGVSYGVPPAEGDVARDDAEGGRRQHRSEAAWCFPAGSNTRPISRCCSARTRMSI